MSLASELKRRNVYPVGITYTVAVWLLIRLADTVFPRIGLFAPAATPVIAYSCTGANSIAEAT